MDTTKPPTDPSSPSPLAKTEPPPAETNHLPAPPSDVTTATEPVEVAEAAAPGADASSAAAPISPEPAFTSESGSETAFAATNEDAERARRQEVSAQVMALVERAVAEAAALVRPLCGPGHVPEEQARLMLLLMTASTYHAITGQGHAALRQVKEAFGPVDLQSQANQGAQIRIVDLPKMALAPIWEDVIEGTKRQVAANNLPVSAEDLCAQAMMELLFPVVARVRGVDGATTWLSTVLASLVVETQRPRR